jgi:hypothetical protein
MARRELPFPCGIDLISLIHATVMKAVFVPHPIVQDCSNVVNVVNTRMVNMAPGYMALTIP